MTLISPEGLDPSSVPLPIRDTQLELRLVVIDSDTVGELRKVPEPERVNVALAALRIGVLALRQARGELDSESLGRQMRESLETLQRQLTKHAETVSESVRGTLAEYFTPTTGRFEERVDRLIKKDGELEQTLRRQLVGADSDLGRTLAQHFGPSSTIIKLLTPTEASGIVNSIQSTVEGVLGSHREIILKQFSLDDESSALSRFRQQVIQLTGEATTDLKDRVDMIVKEFSFDSENSALSRLVKTVSDSHSAITSRFSLDDKESALSRLRAELLDVLREHKQGQQNFQQIVTNALEGLKAGKAERARSTRHGIDFEKDVCAVVAEEASRAGDAYEDVGLTTGEIQYCKKGDGVIQLGTESEAAGARIVVEAKDDASYTVVRALEELRVARQNRKASTSLFVFSEKTAPPGTQRLARYGNDVVIVWNNEDADDPYLVAGVAVAKALAFRQAAETEEQETDLTELDRAVLEIERKTASLDDIMKSATAIRNNADEIVDMARKGRESVSRQIELLKRITGSMRQRTTAESRSRCGNGAAADAPSARS
jgi:hypothetical protein